MMLISLNLPTTSNLLLSFSRSPFSIPSLFAPGLPAVSVQWGPWAEVGMAARAGTTESGGYLRLDPAASLQVRL